METFTCTRPYASTDRDWVSTTGDIVVFQLGDFTWTRLDGVVETNYPTAREAFSGVAAPAIVHDLPSYEEWSREIYA